MALNKFEKSKAAMARGAKVLGGGTNSNFRAGVSPTPLVIDRGEGAYLYDVDGNRHVDYYLAMGPIILGHNPPGVIEAAKRQLDKGIIFASQVEAEFEAGEWVQKLVPCAERVRFAGSGTEVVQAAFRLARAATGRNVIVKFEGHYHGWLDNVLLSVGPAADAAGPADAPNLVPGSPGMDPMASKNVNVLPWNNLEKLKERLSRRDVAAVIMEPAMCNTSAIRPKDGYLEGVRKACTETGTVLIFDEVITGFRVSAGGAQKVLGVTPDLATFGKAIANGFPVAAIAGRADLMDSMVPGKVVHGGTYNGHPVNMAATVAVLSELAKGDVYRKIEKSGKRLMEGIGTILRDHQVPNRVQGFPGIFHVALGTSDPITDYRDSLKSDKARYVKLTGAMVERGVRALERGAWFLSGAHDDAVIDETLQVVEDSVRAALR
ncbi:MAG: aminotransferase class III-fold pyridoxal phosphate-dependent enzyme [Alphaproteobacteria bacterium]|nr:aminotransferase class III-fold pyridoxal phosphate-dependent enzyme [Alphaproteobacteria bacterium]